jgi:predicted metal-dependent hydrolase
MGALLQRIATLLGSPQQLGLWDYDARAERWRVRESGRARRMSARVFRDGRVEIVVPIGTRAYRIRQFAEAHQNWIARTRQRMQRRVAAAPAIDHDFPPTELRLAALGEVIPWRALPLTAGSVEAQRLAAVSWLRERAEAALGSHLDEIAAQMGVSYTRLQIRWQRSRWGSCSRSGTVSLNACLLFQRPEVLRYLLVHELAHRVHMNHGAAFWRLVAQHEPNWRALDRELAQGWQNIPSWVQMRVSQ